MKLARRRVSRRLRHSCLMAVMLAAAGCSPYDRHLVASWYAVNTPPDVPPLESDGAQPPLTQNDRGIEGVYVALLNRGRDMQLYTMRMNGQGEEVPAFIASKLPAGFRPLETGEILTLRVGALRGTDCRMVLPVSLQVTTRPGGRERHVRVAGTMPTALPDEWLEDCAPQPGSQAAPSGDR